MLFGTPQFGIPSFGIPSFGIPGVYRVQELKGKFNFYSVYKNSRLSFTFTECTGTQGKVYFYRVYRNSRVSLLLQSVQELKDEFTFTGLQEGAQG